MKDELQLINTLCESRIFRSKHDLGKYSDKQKRDLYYAVLLATIALALDTKTTNWARQYASSAAAFSNFDFFRVSANDLYVLTYILQSELKAINKQQKQGILRLYRGLGKGNIDKSFVQQTLLRMERTLHIHDGKLRNTRRVLTNWGDNSPVARKAALTQLHRFIRSQAKLAEVLPYLTVLMKGAKGKFGKESPLKKIAAVAGAGLAGLALGLRYDPNKRWKIISDIHGEDVPLKEDRPTQLFQLVTDMRQHPDVEKVISVNYLTDGISAFIRTTDGNAYEMEIRPAPFAKGHEEKRGINEGWEWCVLGESEEPNPDHYNVFSAIHDMTCDGCGEKILQGEDHASWPRRYVSEFHGPVYHLACNETPSSNLGESFDMTDETCTRCGIGHYVETGIQDDMQGVLHCNNEDCRMRVDRHAEAGDQVENNV